VASDRCLFVFTKPAEPGRVKTRLIGALTAEEAAALHQAFLGDLLERLGGGDFDVRLAWALEPGETLPAGPVPGQAQRGGDLGERLFDALAGAAGSHPFVAAVGSDHPDLPLATVEAAFAAVEAGVEVALGPATDGGYYLIALRAEAVDRRLFADIAWSTPAVLAATIDRCRDLGLAVALLPEASDVDTADDLRRLAERLADAGELGGAADCPRTRALLAAGDREAASAG
jgi:rSAM/selenodomain-associated transferase 1